MWAETAKEIWEQVKAIYLKQRHYARIYQLQAYLSTNKQGERSLLAYHFALTSIRKELDYYQSREWESEKDTKAYK